MKVARIRAALKPWMLPIAMAGGIIFHDVMDYLAVLSPYLIFIMLLITYCKVNPAEFRITRLSWMLLSVQIIGGIIIYLLLQPLGETLAQAGFICMFCPTATAAPVITGMLGGSVPRLATFSLVSNFSVAIMAPVLFTLIGAHGHSAELSFINVAALISLKVVPLILGPLAVAMAIKVTVPRFHKAIATRQGLSFYIWAVSLFIVVGKAVSYVIAHIGQPGASGTLMLSIAGISLIVCCLQFYIGRKIGYRYGDRIAGAQGLGQKNTVLAIWMALTFLNPVASIGPAAYVAWQNTINSLQLWFKAKKDAQHDDKSRLTNS
jgi:hypothetical protein